MRDIIVDTDNALGSPHGDVDDGFALFALLKSDLSIPIISSVAGNTKEHLAFENNNTLIRRLGHPATPIRGEDLPHFLSTGSAPIRILALGPLSNLARALTRLEDSEKVEEIIFVGGNTQSRGFLPPIWPFEFNLTKDPTAAQSIISSPIPKTVIPLNVARRLSLGFKEIRSTHESYLIENSRRWWRRALLLKFKLKQPIWDLVAAIYLIRPELFKVRKCELHINQRGKLDFELAPNARSQVVVDFDPNRVWQEFKTIISS